MSAEPGEVRFLPWVRRGLSTAIVPPQTNDPDPRATVEVTLGIGHEKADQPHEETLESVPKRFRLYGSGDVVQLNPAQVIATDPKPFANDFEPNYLASVTLDALELPWVFTPDPSPSETSASGRLTPWLSLIVVRRDRARITADARRPLPTLELVEPTGELQNLAEAWAWAHAQVVGPATTTEDAIRGPPERTLSRLVCPRRLAPGTAYVACIVPTFAAGRQAGLGEKVAARFEPAWQSTDTRVELPVYYQWEFITGAAGDFRSLVRRLEPRALAAEVGLRPMDISGPGPGLPQLKPGDPGSVLGLEGALRSPATVPTPWPRDPRREFQRALEAQLAKPQGEAETVVVPPVYGELHADAVSIAETANPPVWLRDLNLDPRHRAAAALGVRVVQEQQEQLMASAWDQAGEARRANQLLREAQLARAVAGSLREKRLEHLPAEAVLRVTEPAHARIAAPPAAPAGESASLLGSVRESVFPEAAMSPPFRRLLRPLGPVGKRVGAEQVGALVEGLAEGEVEMPIVPVIPGTVEHDQVGSQQLERIGERVPDPERALGWKKVDEFIDPGLVEPDLAPPSANGEVAPGAPERVRASIAIRLPGDDLPGDADEPLPRRSRRLSGINSRFRRAADELQTYIAQAPAETSLRAAAPAKLPVAAIASQLVGRGGRLDPDLTVPTAVRSLITGPGVTAVTDDLAPLRVAPRFPQPMSVPLRELAPDVLLPGAENVPPDSVGLLVGNPRFIEAYLVGLNDEFGREARWRGLTVDPRATFFDQFWDARGRDPAAPGTSADIPPITGWDEGNGLGANATRIGGQDMLVLLVRGELLRRYPTATIYALREEEGGRLGTEERYPEFRGMLEPDLVFVGFGLSVAQVRGSEREPGWFFVIQQHATEPRFGLDDVPDEGDPASYGGIPTASWRELHWGQLVTTEAALGALTHVSVENPPNPRLRGLTLEEASWGSNAADMAKIFLRLPVRVAIHARAMLPPVNAPPSRITAVKRGEAHVLAVGGVDRFGEPWQLTEAEAIAAIRAEARTFVVERPEGDRVEVVIAHRRGREYLKTSADGDLPNNLLALPELPT